MNDQYSHQLKPQDIVVLMALHDHKLVNKNNKFLAYYCGLNPSRMRESLISLKIAKLIKLSTKTPIKAAVDELMSVIKYFLPYDGKPIHPCVNKIPKKNAMTKDLLIKLKELDRIRDLDKPNYKPML